VNGTLTRFRQLIGFVGTIGDTYVLKMKYRTDWAEAWRIYACGTIEAIDMSLAINAGNAISYSGEVTLASAANMILNFYNLGANPSCFIEIDEILFYKK